MTEQQEFQASCDAILDVIKAKDKYIYALQTVIDAKTLEIADLQYKLAAHGESTCHKAVTFTADGSRMCVDCGVVL